MAQATSGTIELDGGAIHYEMAGAGNDTVVFCHAGFVDSRMWDGQWAALGQRYRVIRYDGRGFGKSSPAQGPVERRAELGAVLDRLDIGRAILVGCSLGGGTALDFTLEHADRVAALALISAVPGGFAFQGEPPSELFELMAAVEAGDLDQASELQNRLWIDGPFRQPGEVDAQVRRRAAEMNRIALENQTMPLADSAPLNPLDPPAAGRLAEIRAPALIVAGALDNPEIVRAANEMAAAIGGARKEIMADCAHLPSMERPTEFNRLLLEFLAQR